MKPRLIFALLALVLVPPAPILAQNAPVQGANFDQSPQLYADLAQMVRYPSILTIDRPEAAIKGKTLTVTSTTFGPDGEIPVRSSGMGDSISPQVSWSKGPPGTKSYVLFLEDGVANRGREGTLHWMAFNIPANVTNLPEGLSVKAKGLKEPVGTMKEGANIDQTVSYTGMGGGPTGNNYRLQIFALDTMLNLPSGAYRDEVWTAMNGHVLANGKLWGYFRAPNARPLEPNSVAALNAAANVQRGMILPTLLTIDRPQGQVKGSLTVSSHSFTKYGADGIIPRAFTGRSFQTPYSPEVSWSKGPPGTRSYVLVFENGLANTDRAGTLEWLAFDIPANVTHLPEGLSQQDSGLAKPVGTMKEGANADGKAAYRGMMAIPAAPAFHYHLQILALDSLLGLPKGASREEVWRAMSGHVLAKGKTIGFYQAPNTPQAILPPPPRGR